MPAQGNNEKCGCGSGKKFKKCCKDSQFEYVEPQSIFQSIARDIIAERLRDIKEPHCMICGDTNDLINIQMNIGEKTFCRFCHGVQMSMSS
jgi:hypothetical protein